MATELQPEAALYTHGDPLDALNGSVSLEHKLAAAVKTAQDIAHIRDLETGAHIER